MRAIMTYIDRTKALRQSNQLFVSWAPPHMGKPISKQRLSHWLVGAIVMPYDSKGCSPPKACKLTPHEAWLHPGLCFGGISVQEICSAACWTNPGTFVRFYHLDVTKTPVAHPVLSVGFTWAEPNITLHYCFRVTHSIIVLGYCMSCLACEILGYF